MTVDQSPLRLLHYRCIKRLGTPKQRCEYYENEVQDETYGIRILSRREIEINGSRYNATRRAPARSRSP